MNDPPPLPDDMNWLFDDVVDEPFVTDADYSAVGDVAMLMDTPPDLKRVHSLGDLFDSTDAMSSAMKECTPANVATAPLATAAPAMDACTSVPCTTAAPTAPSSCPVCQKRMRKSHKLPPNVTAVPVGVSVPGATFPRLAVCEACYKFVARHFANPDARAAHKKCNGGATPTKRCQVRGVVDVVCAF